MKIIVGLIHHESNSFNPELTDIGEFKILKGEEIREKGGGAYKNKLEGDN